LRHSEEASSSSDVKTAALLVASVVILVAGAFVQVETITTQVADDTPTTEQHFLLPWQDTYQGPPKDAEDVQWSVTRRHAYGLLLSEYMVSPRSPSSPRERAAKRLSQSFLKDQRIPSTSDLSGVWTSGLGLSGFDIQIEQHADKIEGRGFHWHCSGLSGPFTVAGSCREGVVSLRFTGDNFPAEPKAYAVRETPKGITLDTVKPQQGRADQLFRVHDLREFRE
jgi:hypothetical protein